MTEIANKSKLDAVTKKLKEVEKDGKDTLNQQVASLNILKEKVNT